MCYGKQIKVMQNVTEYDECLKKCKLNSKCNWVSYHQNADEQKSLCHLNGACYQILNHEELNKHYRYANKKCPLQLMSK